jgi:tripartite-type tricarboxylate transporter receptor subunit TctC
MKIEMALACALTMPAALAHAQAYPQKPSRLIVPLAAGGPSDHMARTLAQKLSEGVKQSVIVDNRPGASGIIGTELVAKSPPDGYTLLLSQTAVSINAVLIPKLPYDTLKDLQAVSQLTAAPYILAVHPSLPVHTPKALIALAKARPGELNHASGGSGTGPHLAMALLMQKTGTKITQIAYKGGGPAMIDFIAGQTQVFMTNAVVMLPQMKAGRARGLAVTSARRSQVAPELPTIAETIYPGYEEGAAHGIMAPAGVPKPILDKLHAEIVKAMRSPEVDARLKGEGADVVASSPDEYAVRIRADIDKWSKVIRQAGIRPE